jgi:hypothetical protein
MIGASNVRTIMLMTFYHMHHYYRACAATGDMVWCFILLITITLQYSESGCLHMQVAAQDFCVVFIREKKMNTYPWIDPNRRNNGYNVKLEIITVIPV